jgi:hypothetical protein
MVDFPEGRTSNGGRRIVVDRNEDHPERIVFSYDEEEVAELHPPEPDGPERTDDMAEWRLTFFDQFPETTVLGDPEEPPIDGALLYVDMMLDDRDENEE